MIRLLTLIFAFTALTAVNVYAGGFSDGTFDLNETDAEHEELVGVFDLRDRETFIQVTLSDNDADTLHVQIFNIAQGCGENNFFDEYTGNDTHVYNLRNIVTNDGNDAGFTLPDDAYGFIVLIFEDEQGIGNIRMVDASGYEYRTNLQGVGNNFDDGPDTDDNEWWFNFNSEAGVVLSDIFAVVISEADQFSDGAKLAPITETFTANNVEIINLDEVIFSCTDIIFACTDGTDVLIPELLEDIADQTDDDLSNIRPEQVNAYFGINESIPSSKGGPVACPNNTITAGTIFFNEERNDIEEDYDDAAVIVFVGLNDGNGRGSMDAIWSGESIFDTGEDD